MKSLVWVIPALSLASCSDSSTKEIVEEKDTLNVNRIKSLVIGDPLDCGLEKTLMFPIGSSYLPDVFEGMKWGEQGNYFIDASSGITVTGTTVPSYTYAVGYSDLNFSINSGGSTFYDKHAKIEYANEHQDQFDITNILFYDLISGESFPLIKNDTLHILSFAIHKEFNNELIFYRAVRNDYNADEKFDAADPVMLFVSPLNGDTLIQVTPDGEQFIDYFYYKEEQKILAKTLIDADQDSIFTAIDETNYLELSLNQPSTGRSIFSKDLKNILKAQING